MSLTLLWLMLSDSVKRERSREESGPLRRRHSHTLDATEPKCEAMMWTA